MTITQDGSQVVKLIANYHNVGDFLGEILPIFGANPLSNVFAEKPIMLVEGDDDLRIWEQVTRSTKGKFNFQPCAVDGKPNFQIRETELEQILSSLYDSARAYSVRDGDGIVEQLTDTPCVARIRLRCREVENLLLSDEVIEHCGLTWAEVEKRCEEYIEKKPDSPTGDALILFRDGGYDRINAKLERIRTTLPDLLEKDWSWEVLIGKVIADAILNNKFKASNTSLKAMFGEKFWGQIMEPCLA